MNYFCLVLLCLFVNMYILKVCYCLMIEILNLRLRIVVLEYLLELFSFKKYIIFINIVLRI